MLMLATSLLPFALKSAAPWTGRYYLHYALVIHIPATNHFEWDIVNLGMDFRICGCEYSLLMHISDNVVYPDTQVTFLKAALECLKEVLSGLEMHDMLSLVAPVLLEAASVAPKEKPVTKDAKDGTEKEEEEDKPLPLVETLQCLAAACRHASALWLQL